MRSWTVRAVVAVAFLTLPSCERGKAPPAEGEPEATASDGTVEGQSLLGRRLERPSLPEAFRRQQEGLLSAARAVLEARPDDPEALIWVARRTAYLGRYQEAIDLYAEGIAIRPEEAKLYRHRGHRYITTRQLDAAVADLERAAVLIEGRPDEAEPAGLPNEGGVPTSTSHSNIWYHLGLAYYLQGEFDSALRAFRECLRVSATPDMVVAASHWLYMTLRRTGREAEAEAVLEPIDAGLDVIENRDYHRLILMYKGQLTPRELRRRARSSGGLSVATVGYGVGNWYLYNGRADRAVEVFRGIVEGSQWAAFGFIAAEAELARMGD